MTGIDRLLTLERIKKDCFTAIEKQEFERDFGQEYQSLREKLKKAEEHQKEHEKLNILGRCTCCHSEQHDYTKIGGCKKSDCCDYNVHFNKCSHGDCSCECHILNQNQKTPDEKLDLILLQQVIDIFSSYCGETGQNEGLIECIKRKLSEIK